MPDFGYPAIDRPFDSGNAASPDLRGLPSRIRRQGSHGPCRRNLPLRSRVRRSWRRGPPGGSTSWGASPTTRARWFCSGRSVRPRWWLRRPWPTPGLKLASLPTEKGREARVFELDATTTRQLLEGGYEAARRWFARDPALHWAAYVVGVLIVLERERGLGVRMRTEDPDRFQGARGKGSQLVRRDRGRDDARGHGAVGNHAGRYRGCHALPDGRELRGGCAVRHHGPDDLGPGTGRRAALVVVPAGEGAGLHPATRLDRLLGYRLGHSPCGHGQRLHLGANRGLSWAIG